VADYATFVQDGTKNMCSYQVYTIPIIRRQGAILQGRAVLERD
jgi:hypothetical protein